MSEKTEERDVKIYSYMRKGILYHTSNEQIAISRSDTGEYMVEYVSNDEINKD